jgi:hypothetical protein
MAGGVTASGAAAKVDVDQFFAGTETSLVLTVGRR